MFFITSLLKELKTTNKFKEILAICKDNNCKELKKYLRKNDVNINELIKVLDYSYETLDYKLGCELLKYHYKKTLGLTQDRLFNKMFFSPIQNLYVKQYTFGKYRRHDVSISFASGVIKSYNQEVYKGKIV